MQALFYRFFLPVLKKGIYEKVVDNAIYQISDSRTLNQALKNGEADVLINWKATAYFDENKAFIEALELTSDDAKMKRLVLNLLTFSKQPALAKKFMTFTTSSQGRAIFLKYGFASPDNEVY